MEVLRKKSVTFKQLFHTLYKGTEKQCFCVNENFRTEYAVLRKALTTLYEYNVIHRMLCFIIEKKYTHILYNIVFVLVVVPWN